MLLTSQLPAKQWHEHLADQTIADAILDRILNNAHRLVLKGPTRRSPDATEERDTNK
jgi:DNA replication protein DnaC